MENLQSANRLNSFSDCVISILITIMMLDLKAPHGGGWSVMNSLWPAFSAYGLSYMFVGICWVNHRHVMAYVTRCVPSIVWSNLVFMFTMSFIPFSTSYVADEKMSSFSVMIYALTFIPVIISFMVLETILAYGTDQNTGFRAGYRAVLLRGLLALAIYVAAIVTSYFSSRCAFMLILLNTLLYITPEKLITLGTLVSCQTSTLHN